jgi:hypothetical protein
VPPHKRTKTDRSVTEKEPHQKSAEPLARAALANVDANRPAPPDALIGPGLTDTPASADIRSRRANVPPRQANVGPPQPVAAPPRAGGMEVAPHAADVQPQPVGISPATGANLQPGARDVRPDRVTPVDIQSRPVAAVDPRSPRADPPLEISAPQQPPTGDQDKGLFSALSGCPICCALLTRRRLPVKPCARPCRSGRRCLTKIRDFGIENLVGYSIGRSPRTRAFENVSPSSAG